MTGSPDPGEMEIDLDARRRARAEKLGNPKAVVGGRAYLLRADMPMSGAFAYRDALKAETPEERVAATRELVETMLLDRSEVDDFLANRLSVFDVIDVYSPYAPVGESSASSKSSTNDGKPSRPTSKRTTASTSRKRSTKKR